MRGSIQSSGLAIGTLAMCTMACSGGGSGANTCAEEALEVYFSPMYSAYDGLATHRFQVPAIVNGVDESYVTWTASDESVVSLSPDPVTGGIMITALKPGTVTITAQAGNLCGTSLLTIEAANTTEWQLGHDRYNNGEPDGGATSDAGGLHGIPNTVNCTLCHGPTASGPFIDVAHTPEQTGGFSDSDLEGIIRHGSVPDGGYFDPAILPYDRWQQFHQWAMSDQEFKGIVVYLRSLTPTPQMGSSNFGGHGGPRDGGFGGRDGGFSARDAGAPDAG